jgi:hypothetical protein
VSYIDASKIDALAIYMQTLDKCNSSQIFRESGQQTRIDTLFVLKRKKNSLLDYSVAKFLVSDWGEKVNSDIALSYRAARLRLHRLAGRYDNLILETTISPILM